MNPKLHIHRPEQKDRDGIDQDCIRLLFLVGLAVFPVFWYGSVTYISPGFGTSGCARTRDRYVHLFTSRLKGSLFVVLTLLDEYWCRTTDSVCR
jgi:hypothetical protein